MSRRTTVFTTEINSRFVGQDKGFTHELPDQSGMVRQVCKWATRVTEGRAAAALTNNALAHARTGRPPPTTSPHS